MDYSTCGKDAWKRRSDLEVLDELSLVVWFFLRISEQRAALTSDLMVFWREEMLGVVVVGMKLVPLLSNEMASGGSDVEVKL